MYTYIASILSARGTAIRAVLLVSSNKPLPISSSNISSALAYYAVTNLPSTTSTKASRYKAS